MKFLYLFFLALQMTAINSQAQNENPVTWTFELEQVDEKTYDLIATAKMKEHWVIYSQHTDPDGPVPTYFEFEATDGLQFVGDVEEVSKKMVQFSELFEVEVSKFKEEAIFKQRFTTQNKAVKLSGSVTYMTCDSQKCLPPKDVPFQVTL
jgi:hypothetical protein